MGLPIEEASSLNEITNVPSAELAIEAAKLELSELLLSTPDLLKMRVDKPDCIVFDITESISETNLRLIELLSILGVNGFTSLNHISDKDETQKNRVVYYINTQEVYALFSKIGNMQLFNTISFESRKFETREMERVGEEIIISEA